MTRKRRWPLVVAVVSGLLLAGGVAFASNPFTDVAGNTHESDIDAIYTAGITSGCTATTYCPADAVKRDQMATFLARTAGLSNSAIEHFPIANARGQSQTYCTLAAVYPRTFDPTPCDGSDTVAAGLDDEGLFADVAIGADGLPIVSSYDATTKDLVLRHCRNVACTNGSDVNVPDTAGDVGRYTSIAVGVDGLPVVSYYDKTNGNLKVLHCADIACNATPTIAVVDQTGDVGQYSSIAIGQGGGPIISYFDATATDPSHVGHLKVAVCLDVDCTTTPLVTTADPADGVGISSSIALGSDGVPVVAYYDAANARVKVMHCGTNGCASPTSVPITSGQNQGQYVSLAVGTDGFPVISYRVGSDTLAVAHCSTVTCSAVTATPVEVTSNDGSFSSIAIGLNGFPVISYFDDGDAVLRLARCANRACTSASLVTVATVGASNSNSSVAIATDGEPVIAYYESTVKKLKVARSAMPS